MTPEEAIEWIKDHHCPDDFVCDCKDTMAMRVAIDALKKQIPQKPTSKGLKTWSDEITVLTCPTCGHMVSDSFCGGCGQAIDWSE